MVTLFARQTGVVYGDCQKSVQLFERFFSTTPYPSIAYFGIYFLKAVSWDRTETVPKKMGRILEDPTRLL